MGNRPRIKRKVASSSYKQEKTIAELRAEMRKLRSDIKYLNSMTDGYYKRIQAIIDGSADLSIKEVDDRNYTEHRCFGKVIKIYN